MQLLTPSGYKNIEDCQIGEQLIAYDIFTGQVIINELLNKSWFDYDMFEDSYSLPEEYIDENGDTVTKPPVLLKTKKENFESVHGELKGYVINNKWTLYRYQSVWANMNITHAQDLQIGDIVYDDDDNDVEITSIQEVDLDGWWRLKVSGDHSYIADDLTLHNATRYWVGGGSSANWNATANTNWGSASGGANNASVPTSADDVIFDGAGTNGNTNSIISATITILSLDIQTGYTAIMTHNAILTIAGNFTFTGNYARAGSSGVTISATSTIVSNGVTWNLPLNFDNIITVTLNGNLTVSGLVTITLRPTFTRTASEDFIFEGGLTCTANQFTSGNVKFIWKSGTFEVGGIFNSIRNNTDIDGNITIRNLMIFNSCNLTYISGNVNTINSQLNFSGGTINTFGINWWNVNLLGSTTLSSNLIVNNVFGASGTTNRTTNETITAFNGATALQNGNTGTAEIIVKGGVITSGHVFAATFGMPLTIDGNVTFANNTLWIGPPFGGGFFGTLKYLSGVSNSKNVNLTISDTSTFINVDKMPFRSVSIPANRTMTMDRFFSGSDSNICQITSTGANYTIAFTDGFEKIAKNVAISGATLSRPNQLLVVTNARFNTNRGTNVGLRYKNEMPNGFSKGLQNGRNLITPSEMLVSDPNFLRQG